MASAGAARYRFIPFQKSELLDMLCRDGRLDAGAQAKLRSFARVLESLYHFWFHAKLEELKKHYYPFNPDHDTRTLRRFTPEELAGHEKALVAKLKELLDDANFEEITQADLDRAVREQSLFEISLQVDFGDFDSQIVFWRGDVVRTATVRRLFFFRREIEVPTFERVVLLIKFKDAEHFRRKKRRDLLFEPSSMVLKLFKNIPKADLEMLFPNTQVRMTLKDKLLLGVPGLAGGISMAVKMGATLGSALALIWLVLTSYVTDTTPRFPSAADMTKIVGGLTALGALGGYLWRQWNAYKNRKMHFMKTLADSLYFKNLDNNAGVFFHVVDAAEEEECKEALLAYYFLLTSERGFAERPLDEAVEAWFAERHGVTLDFEVDDALRKLRELELCHVTDAGAGAGADGAGPIYRVPPLDEACRRVDEIWDGLFQFNNVAAGY